MKSCWDFWKVFYLLWSWRQTVSVCLWYLFVCVLISVLLSWLQKAQDTLSILCLLNLFPFQNTYFAWSCELFEGFSPEWYTTLKFTHFEGLALFMKKLYIFVPCRTMIIFFSPEWYLKTISIIYFVPSKVYFLVSVSDLYFLWEKLAC